MTRNYFLTLLASICISLSTSAQYFEKTYATTFDKTARDILQTDDGGFLVCGMTNNTNPADCDLYVMKLNGSGDKIWDTIYGGARVDYAYHMIKTNDNNFIIVGYSASFSGGDLDMYALKVNQNGRLIKQINIGSTSNEEARQIVKTPDNNYLIVGTSDLGGPNSQVRVVKVSENLDYISEKTYGTSTYDFGLAIESIADGYLIGGQTYGKGAGAGDAWLLKVNSSLDMVWDTTYGQALNQEIVDIVGNSDGTYVLAIRDSLPGGNPDDGNIDVTLVKANKSGVIWKKSWGGTDKDTPKTLNKVNGGYLVGAISRSGKPAPDMWIIKVKEDGEAEWIKSFGVLSQHDHCHMAKELSNGDIVLAGHRQENAKMVYVLRLGSAGTVGIQESRIAEIFKMYPCPVQDQILIEGDHTDAVVTITDMTGRVVARPLITLQENQLSRMGVDLPAGVYVLRMQTANGTHVTRFIAE